MANHHPLLKTITLTALALLAFAANSVICRLALGNHAIDASTFTVLRLLSGSIVLLLLMTSMKKNTAVNPTKGSWGASFMLFLYAVTFSYAYITLDTGTGALILFAAVQITMVVLSIISGNRLRFNEWLGAIIAFSGFVYLILPRVTAPSMTGFFLMTVAGIAWGIYTLQGRNSTNPLMDTAYNFFRTTPFIVLLALITINNHTSASWEGIVWALLSGGLTSGIGYTVWYIALQGLSSTLAAVLQLSVPVIAALGGVLFVSEEISVRLIVSTFIVLGGILVVILGQAPRKSN
ncbi:MAG: DMT family transporter [Mariprofundaceae bacterium]|nr:DMT family transporter [Mariprofundaceae bacterium]